MTFDARWLGIIGSFAVALLALYMMLRERNWERQKFSKEMREAVLQPDFVEALRKELEKDVQKHIAMTMEQLTDEVTKVVETVKQHTLEGVDAALKENRTLLDQATHQEVTSLTSLVSTSSASLKQNMAMLEKHVADTHTEYEAVLGSYREHVTQRVKQLVDERAADMLAEYLQSSLTGLELGNQQDLILARLDANKAALLEELGHE